PIEHSEGKSAGNHLIALACTQSAITIWLSRYGALRERDIVKSPERPSLRVRRPLFFLGQQYTTEIEAAPGVHPAKARRIAANIPKLPKAVIRSVELIRPTHSKAAGENHGKPGGLAVAPQHLFPAMDHRWGCRTGTATEEEARSNAASIHPRIAA